MSIEQSIKLLSDRVLQHGATMLTEEAVKTAIVLPFLQSLGYDVFNPLEVIPEFNADAVGKKGEKVDYALRIDSEVKILIECKPITTKLEKVHLAQLFRYFTVTPAKFAILTNGRDFRFYSDLDEPNKLDSRPFLTFDLAEPQAHVLAELKKFEKTGFDVDAILADAERLRFTSAVKGRLQEIMDAPPEEFVRLVAASMHSGRFTAAVVEQYRDLIRSAFRDLIREAVRTRISSALESSEEPAAGDPAAAQESDIHTTPEETEGFMMVKAIAAQVIKPSRVFMRDQKTYCGILIDDNNRKPLARLHFNRTVKYIGLFDGDTEDRVALTSLEDIYSCADRIRATASKYLNAK